MGLIMGSGIDKHLRHDFLKRLQATKRFWEMSKIDYMFVDPEFHASISVECGELSRPDEDEKWPEPSNPYYYVNSFKPHSKFIEKMLNILEHNTKQIGVFPVNTYATGIRIDGPYLHPIKKLVDFTPRRDSDHWIHDWPWLNSGQSFFVSQETEFVIYTTHSSNPNSVDYLMADKSFIDYINKNWPDIIDFVHR